VARSAASRLPEHSFPATANFLSSRSQGHAERRFYVRTITVAWS
jgi:hypothetical protein